MKRGRMRLMIRNEGDHGIVVVVVVGLVVSGNTRDVEEVPFLFEFCCVLAFGSCLCGCSEVRWVL